MFEQDYLMRIIAQLLGAIRRSMERAAGEEDPDGAARALDMALGDATDLAVSSTGRYSLSAAAVENPLLALLSHCMGVREPVRK